MPDYCLGLKNVQINSPSAQPRLCLIDRSQTPQSYQTTKLPCSSPRVTKHDYQLNLHITLGVYLLLGNVIQQISSLEPMYSH